LPHRPATEKRLATVVRLPAAGVAWQVKISGTVLSFDRPGKCSLAETLTYQLIVAAD